MRCAYCGDGVSPDSDGGARFCSMSHLITYYDELMGDDLEDGEDSAGEDGDPMTTPPDEEGGRP